MNIFLKKIFRIKKIKSNNGFVLVLAVLLSGILLSIGITMFGLTFKELLISSAGRESQFAFYAADTAGECVLYWDIRHPGYSNSIFATSSASTLISKNSGILCNEEDITSPTTGWDVNSGWDITNITGTSATTVFDMKFDNGACATVTIIKNSGLTQIDSRGYNTCVTNPRRVERGLRISY
jgi:Tfp pilus assembly protein PilX